MRVLLKAIAIIALATCIVLCIFKTWIPLAVLLALHLLELLISLKVGKIAKKNVFTSICCTLLFGVTWWLPLYISNKRNINTMISGKSFVIIKDTPQNIDFLLDAVTLNKDYGKKTYFLREDVKAINSAVYSALDELDTNLHFTSALKHYKQIIIKPDLSLVYYQNGFAESQYPQTTDPRVIDAVVTYVKRYNKNIAIVESSNKPIPTNVSFKQTGLDKLARHHKIKLYDLEKYAISRYILPKAEKLKDVYISEVLNEVINGESYYISIPKMKTSVCSQVSLTLNNNMGLLPYFFRENNFICQIEKKLADLLYLIKPNLTIVDAVIGGQGNAPSPIDSVKVDMIICGNNCVEVDRVATYIMGLDGDENLLIKEASTRGFGDKTVKVLGIPRLVKFNPTYCSLLEEQFTTKFPNVVTVVGYEIVDAPKVTSIDEVTPEMVLQFEGASGAGHIANAIVGFESVARSLTPKCDFPLTIVVGGGLKIKNTLYWFDKEGKAYTNKDIKRLRKPICTLGSCAKPFCGKVKYKLNDCDDAIECMKVACKIAKIKFPLLTPKNKYRGQIVNNIKSVIKCRQHLIKCSYWVDVFNGKNDKALDIPKLKGKELKKGFILYKFPIILDDAKQTLIDQQRCIIKSLL